MMKDQAYQNDFKFRKFIVVKQGDSHEMPLVVDFLQLLGHIVTCMPGREIFEFAKDVVTVLLVKFRGLKTECVEKDIGRAAFARFVFGLGQQLVTIALPAQFFAEEEQVDIKPTPVDFADQAANHFVIRPIKGKAEMLEAFEATMLLVI